MPAPESTAPIEATTTPRRQVVVPPQFLLGIRENFQQTVRVNKLKIPRRAAGIVFRLDLVPREEIKVPKTSPYEMIKDHNGEDILYSDFISAKAWHDTLPDLLPAIRSFVPDFDGSRHSLIELALMPKPRRHAGKVGGFHEDRYLEPKGGQPMQFTGMYGSTSGGTQEIAADGTISTLQPHELRAYDYQTTHRYAQEELSEMPTPDNPRLFLRVMSAK